MKDIVENILFKLLPEKYEEMGDEEYWCKTEVVNIIHEMLTRAYYMESLNMIEESTETWMTLAYPYFNGNIEALNFLMTLETLSTPQATGKDLLAMIMSMGLKGSDLTIFFKECCGESYQELLKIYIIWKDKRISMIEILSHMKDGYGIKIKTEKL